MEWSSHNYEGLQNTKPSLRECRIRCIAFNPWIRPVNDPAHAPIGKTIGNDNQALYPYLALQL